MNMSHMGGIDVLKQLRQRQSNVLVVLMTGFGTPAETVSSGRIFGHRPEQPRSMMVREGPKNYSSTKRGLPEGLRNPCRRDWPLLPSML
ncbi:MAG: response regulator [Gemmataceae bacterium]|nr:response regulator [Gemmataceae bacterium]